MKRILALIQVLAWGPAAAIPVEWTINDHQFDDGHYISGIFTYDADTGMFTDLYITSHASQEFTYIYDPEIGYSYNYPGYTDSYRDDTGYGWTTWDPNGPYYGEGRTTIHLTAQEGWDYYSLDIVLRGELTNSGGTLELVGGQYGTREFIEDIYTATVDQHYSSVDTGTLSSVPVPAAVWLFSSALFGLGFLRKRIEAP